MIPQPAKSIRVRAKPMAAAAVLMVALLATHASALPTSGSDVASSVAGNGLPDAPELNLGDQQTGSCQNIGDLGIPLAPLCLLKQVVGAVLFVAGIALYAAWYTGFQLDQDADGLGDVWEQDWLDRSGELIITSSGDLDGDGLYNIDEFRWILVPVCVGPAVQNCDDHEKDPLSGTGGDNWNDRAEVDYWNDASNDDLSSDGFAFFDPDRSIDSDGDGRSNVDDADSDNDDLLDGDEAKTYGSYPEFLDSDCGRAATTCTASSDTTYNGARTGSPGTGDGMNDGTELAAWLVFGSSAWSTNFDGDDIDNNLLDPDADNDGWQDGVEFYSKTDPRDSGSHPPIILPAPQPYSFGPVVIRKDQGDSAPWLEVTQDGCTVVSSTATSMLVRCIPPVAGTWACHNPGLVAKANQGSVTGKTWCTNGPTKTATHTSGSTDYWAWSRIAYGYWDFPWYCEATFNTVQSTGFVLCDAPDPPLIWV